MMIPGTEGATRAGTQESGAVKLHVGGEHHRINRWYDGVDAIEEVVWTSAEWEAMAEGDRPGKAQPLDGIGWSLVRRVGPDQV